MAHFQYDTLAFLELQKPYESILSWRAPQPQQLPAPFKETSNMDRPSASLSSFIKMFKNARPLQQADYDLIVSTLPEASSPETSKTSHQTVHWITIQPSTNCQYQLWISHRRSSVLQSTSRHSAKNIHECVWLNQNHNRIILIYYNGIEIFIGESNGWRKKRKKSLV